MHEHPEFSQSNLACASGVSVSAVHCLLAPLMHKWTVKLHGFAPSSCKPLPICCPRAIAENATLTQHLLARKHDEYGALRVHIDGLQAELAADRADALEQTII